MVAINSTQARLIAAVKDAMEAQGIKIKDIASAARTSSSYVCDVMGGRCNMSKGKWELICDRVGLDYEQVISDLPQVEGAEHAETLAQEVPQQPIRKKTKRKSKQDPSAMTPLEFDCMILANYAKLKLDEDIKMGVEMSFESLFVLMQSIRRHMNVRGETDGTHQG